MLPAPVKRRKTLTDVSIFEWGCQVVFHDDNDDDDSDNNDDDVDNDNDEDDNGDDAMVIYIF